MKRFILILTIALGLTAKMQAQVGFTRTYGAPGLFNDASDIAVDSEGNVYICGSTGGYGAQNGDAAVVVTDSLGEQLDFRTYGGFYSESGKCIAMIPSGGYAVAGTSNRTQNLSHQIYFVLADQNGNALVDTVYEAVGWNTPTSMLRSDDGSFVIAYNRTSSDEADKTAGVLKISPQGEILWQTELSNSPGSIYLNDLIELTDSTLIIVGKGNEAVSDSSDMQFVKLAFDGHLLWSKFYGTQGDEWAASVCSSEQNVIAVAGNRVLENGETSPQLLNLDTAGNVTNEFFDSGYAEVNSIAYNPVNSSLIIAWDYSSSGTPKTALFNFTIDLVYRCSSLPVSPLTAPLSATASCAGLNGQMHLCGNMEDTGPGIISMFSFKTGSSCEHTTGLQIGIEEAESSSAPFLFPNPAENSIHLRWDENLSINDVIILDQSSRQLDVDRFDSGHNEWTFDIGALAPGFYFMQIPATGNSAFYCYPFIIKR